MYKKIDIYLKNLNGFWQYECSTNASVNCKQAKQSFMSRHYLDGGQVKASYAEKTLPTVKTHYYNTKLPQKNCICRLCKQIKSK